MSSALPTPTALSFTLPAPDLSAWRAGNTGTQGVWHFDSGVPGRHVMISALLHLGIKNIRLGPTLPAFVTPTVLQVLIDKFSIKPTTTVERDMEAALACA